MLLYVETAACQILAALVPRGPDDRFDRFEELLGTAAKYGDMIA